MTTAEAIRICEDWFSYLKRQQDKAVELQRLAALARSGQGEEARRRMRQLDRPLTVYDGARLEPAVQHLVVEMDRLHARLAGEREPPHCQTCACGLSPPTQATPHPPPSTEAADR